MSPTTDRAASWSSTFSRFTPGRMTIGPVAINVADWSQPRGGSAHIFESTRLEGMSYAGPLKPIALYVPAGAALLWLASRSGVSAWAMIAAYAAGALAWSLFEYLMHRFVFHYTPSTPAGVVVQYLIHGVHHAFPNDDRRWMIPIGVSLPIATVIGLTGWTLGGISAMPALVGFLHGYLAYDLLHYQVHRSGTGPRWLRALRAQHMRHHYAHPDREFGVSSALWDAVFRTTR